MKIETIEKIFKFLEKKEGKEIPETVLDFIAKEKFIQELENHPDGTQYRHKGNVYLADEKTLTKLPNDLHVDGDLVLKGCTKLIKLPDKLYVRGKLTLRRCRQLTKLPDNLHIDSYLDLDNSGIINIPNNLYVEGDLYIYDTPLAKKYTHEEIREMIKSKGGTVIGKIHR